MKVNLIKEATYDLNENKSSKIPFDTFIKMCGTTVNKENTIEEKFPDVRIFASIEEFKALPNSVMDKFDTTKDVYVLSNGNFCVFMNENVAIKAEAQTKTTTSKKVENNATTSTKKDTESAATDLV